MAAGTRATSHRERVPEARGIGAHERIFELRPELGSPSLKGHAVLKELSACHSFKSQRDQLNHPDGHRGEFTKVREDAGRHDRCPCPSTIDNLGLGLVQHRTIFHLLHRLVGLERGEGFPMNAW